METAYIAIAIIGSTIVFKAVTDLFHSHIVGIPYTVKLPVIAHTKRTDKVVSF